MELDDSNKTITTKKEKEDYNKLIQVLDKKFIKDDTILNNAFEYIDTGRDRIEVTLVLFITSGQISSYNIGTLPSQLDPLISFDEWQTKGLSEIYNNGINDVLSSQKSKEK